ncbi:Uncharacterised protein [Clostridioides difficile]|nr:Uncharacterised protein [Clostridioides difficile]
MTFGSPALVVSAGRAARAPLACPRAPPAGRAACARVACPRVRRGHLGGFGCGGGFDSAPRFARGRLNPQGVWPGSTRGGCGATPAGRAARARVACPRVCRGHLGGTGCGEGFDSAPRSARCRLNPQWGVRCRLLAENTAGAPGGYRMRPRWSLVPLPTRVAAVCGRCAWPSRRPAGCHRPWGSARSVAPTDSRLRALPRPAVRRA